MQREDQKVTVYQVWDANYGPGAQTVDESTTELRGTRREADLIVAGLRILKAQAEVALAMSGVTLRDPYKVPRQELLSIPEIDKLLESIKEPNYIDEPEERTERR